MYLIMILFFARPFEKQEDAQSIENASEHLFPGLSSSPFLIRYGFYQSIFDCCYRNGQVLYIHVFFSLSISLDSRDRQMLRSSFDVLTTK